MLPKLPHYWWPLTHLRYYSAGCPTYRANILRLIGTREDLTFHQQMELLRDDPETKDAHVLACQHVGWLGKSDFADNINPYTEGECPLDLL